MSKTRVLAVAVLILVALCLFAGAATGEVPIGVKQGDWVEYNVTTTGNPPEEHNVTWARLDILGVADTLVTINSTSRARNGSVSSLVMTLDVEAGLIGAWWVIPANLNVGESFYDAFIGQNITILGEEQLEYAGAVRTVTHSSTPNRVKNWDKTTGVFVETVDALENTTLYAIADKTNMCGEQQAPSDGLLYVAVGAATAEAIAIAMLIVGLASFRRRNRTG